MTALVFGSINMDLVSQTPRLPHPGETLMGSHFFTTPGGKGANQAVALARLGIPTQLIGRLGNDSFGQELLAGLQTAGVNTDLIQIEPDTHSGVAVITVTDTGENQIIGVLGANDHLDATDVARLQTVLPQAQALVMQLEAPLQTVKAAAQAAHAAGIQVILDPAPVPPTPITEIYPFIDLLVPNEVEASQLTGLTVNSPASAAQAAAVLHQQGVPAVIIKLGAQGTYASTSAEQFWVPAFAVEAIDTVAAGDAFAGGLVAGLVAGLPLRQAVVWGNAAGALATTRRGAQAAMCDRATFDAFLAQHAHSSRIESLE